VVGRRDADPVVRLFTDFYGRTDGYLPELIGTDEYAVYQTVILDTYGVLRSELELTPEQDAEFSPGDFFFFQEVTYATVHKEKEGGRVVAVTQRLVPGSEERLQETLEDSGRSEAVVMRFNTDGTVDTGYGTSGTGVSSLMSNTEQSAVAIQPDGKAVIVSGWDNGQLGLFRLLPSAPQIGSFTSNLASVAVGSPVTLTAGGITDGNAGATVTQVAFYADSNGDGVVDPNTDALLGYGVHQADGTWAFTFSTAGWTPGTYRLFAQAKDSYGALGDPLSFDLQLTGSPTPIATGT